MMNLLLMKLNVDFFWQVYRVKSNIDL